MCVSESERADFARATEPCYVHLSTWPQDSGLVPVTSFPLTVHPQVLYPHSPHPAAHRMYLVRLARHACALLWSQFPGRWLVMCVLLDCLYMAGVYHTSPVPLGQPVDNHTASLNTSSHSSPGSPSLSSPLSLASHVAAPPSAAVLPPSSFSSSTSSPSSSSSSSSSSSLSSSSSTSSPVVVNVFDNVNVSESDLTRAQLQTRDNSSGGDHSSDDADSGDHHDHNHNHHDNNTNTNKNGQAAVSSPHAGKVRKEFPLALVVASATAAVSIILFFCLSYLWHTRQLDRRAQKLAIRLAAQAEEDLKCSQCRSRPRYRPGSSQDSGSDSGGEDCRVLPTLVTTPDELNSLNEEDEEEAEGDDGSRRKPGGVGRTLGNRRGSRSRGGRRSGSRSSRKWSGHSSGQTRSSLVTDQEILTHFASRRHSTFFI